MQIRLGAQGPVELDTASKVGASRKHGSPLATVTSYTLGAPTTRVVCNCLQCQAAGLNIEWHEFMKPHTIAGEEEMRVIRKFVTNGTGKV